MRPQNWPALLDTHVEAARRTPFAWGRHDCLSFVCDWHRLMTGRDVFASWRGAYDNETGARRLIVEAGLDGMAAVGGFLFGAARAAPRHARRGDIVLAGKSFGLMTGRAGAFAGETGLVFLPALQFEQAWCV